MLKIHFAGRLDISVDDCWQHDANRIASVANRTVCFISFYFNLLSEVFDEADIGADCILNLAACNVFVLFM
mgnify:FL=1